MKGKKFIQQMKNSFQALVAGKREEEELPPGEEELLYGGGEPRQLLNYSNEALEVVLRRGDLNLLNSALEYMGESEFYERLSNLDHGRRMSICLEQDSNEMTELTMPHFFEDYSGENSVYKMLSSNELYDISAEFVKLVLKLHPDDEIFTRDPSEIPMSLFIHSSIAGKNDVVEILLSKSEAFRGAFSSKQAAEIFIEYLNGCHRSSGSWQAIGFLLDKNPAFAELQEVQQAFSRAAKGHDRNTYNKLECLLNIHPDFAGRVNEEMQHNDVAKNEASHYERVKLLLDRYPALVEAFTRGIQEVIHSVIHYGGYGSGYEKIESLLKSDSRFVMFLDKEVCDSISEVLGSIRKKLRNERIDNLLEICPDIGKFFTKVLKDRLSDYFDTENLEYEKIEFLLKCNSGLGKLYNDEVNSRFLKNIKSENLNYEEIKFLLTMFPFTFNQRSDFKDFHELFDRALSDNKTELIEILLKIGPRTVMHEVDYQQGRSIIEQAKNNRFSEAISANVLKAACEVIYDMMRKGEHLHGITKAAELIKDSLIDYAVSSALQGNFDIINLMMGGYFNGNSYALSSREVEKKLLQDLVINGDTNTMEYVIGMMIPSVNGVRMMCDAALAHGRGEFVEYLVGKFPEIVIPYLQLGNRLESIIKKPATLQGVNIVKHLLFVDELRQGMKVAALDEYVVKLKLLCTTSKASYFFPLSGDIRCNIGEFLLDKQYQPYARVKLQEQSPIPENTLHIKVAAEYMAKVIMNIVNECLVSPLVGEQLIFRTTQCTKWLKDKLEKNMGKFGMIPKHLQKDLVHDVWQAIIDQPPEHQRTKLVVEQAIDAVLGHHYSLLQHDHHALELAGDYRVCEAKEDAV